VWYGRGVIRSGCLLFGALAASTAGCLLYTAPVNTPPVVTMSGPTMVFRGDTATFDAVASDEHQASLLLEWRTQAIERGAACPPGAGGLEVPPVQVSPSSRFNFQGPPAPGVVCVWVVARDDRNAPAWDGGAIEVKNRPPEAVIEVLRPTAAAPGSYPLYAAARLTSKSRDDDHDPLTSVWQLTTPDGKTSTPPGCPMATDDACVELDRPGPYRFELAVRDPFGAEARQEQTLMVAEDHPPCIATTMPDFRIGAGVIPQKSSESLRFELDVVDDDGDPFPPADNRTPTLAWEWRFDDEQTVHRQPYAFPALEFAASVLSPHAGHKLRVSLTYQDRVSRDLSRCSDSEPLCELPPVDPARHCYQRVGWTVQID
jgi:hypothetical protein